MKLLGIDLETGASFDTPQKDNFITEVGLVLWETGVGPMRIESFLVNEKKKVSADASEYTGITNKMIKSYGVSGRMALKKVRYLMEKADRVVAQNGNGFDKPVLLDFFNRYMKKDECLEDFGSALRENWIDTTQDIKYPWTCRYKNLTYVSGFHGFFNPFPHRAATDVLSMLKVLSEYDIEEVLERTDSPEVEVTATLPPSQKEKAKNKSMYFCWDRKVWFKRMKEVDLAEFTKDIPFRYNVEKV